MRILIIDNNIDPSCWGSADLRRMAHFAEGAIVTVRRAPHDDLPLSPGEFDRIVVSGSRTSALEDAPWVFRLHEFIRKSVDLSKPFLGVCYGHQSLIRALGSVANVRKSATPEFGWSEIEALEPTALFNGLPRKFYSFSSHFDEVGDLPPGFGLLARSELCGIQACVLEGHPVFGIQFHPEKDLAGAKISLDERKKKGIPKILLHPDRSDELYDPKVGEFIFKNFFKL